MNLQPRFVYTLLAIIWLLLVGWQSQEHLRVRESEKNDLRSRSEEIADTVSAFIRSFRFRGRILQEQLDPVLNELLIGRTNALGSSGRLISVALLNTAGEPVVAAGKPIDLGEIEGLQQREQWSRHTVVFVMPMQGANIVLPPRQEPTNSPAGGPAFPRREPPPEGSDSNAVRDASSRNDSRPDRPGPPSRGQGGDGPRRGPDRPRWLHWMSQEDYEALLEKRELHGLVLAMSTDRLHAVTARDLWMRCMVAFFAGASVVGVALAWRSVGTSSELQIRLVRASELNTHLREMNLAAAGLAHETRNPLNIIRGLAHMISRQPDAPEETRQKARAILDETDKVTAQLNEFINYSRPRELRRTTLSLHSAINEVVRALTYDIEEKRVRMEIKGEPLAIEADEQLLRQALFNLVINAVQAVDGDGEIQVLLERRNGEASLEIRDNGPGVPSERRKEIFKPYFTTNEKGTGLGLAVVQQIVLAHGWEIECLPNEPRGAIFRITHLKVAPKA